MQIIKIDDNTFEKVEKETIKKDKLELDISILQTIITDLENKKIEIPENYPDTMKQALQDW